MCGIVGAVAQRNIIPVLLEGLKRLEYRGYDSCGVAVHLDGKLTRARSTSRVAELEEQIWTTPAGQATPVVKSGSSYYVALVQERKDGRLRAFDESEVQDAIGGALREQKTLELRRRANEDLQRDAVIQADDAMLTPVVEMAMQLYPAWHAGGR